MHKIKILQIIGSSDIGGAEKLLYSLLRYLDKDRFEIYVACPANGLMLDNFRKYAKEVKTFNFENWFFNLTTIFTLKNYMKQRRIDIVHTHLYSADFLGIIAASLAGVPCKVATIHGQNFRSTGRLDLRSIKNFFYSFIYRAVYIFYDQIIAVCQALKQDLMKRPGIKLEEEKIKVVYNSIDLKETLKQNHFLHQRLKNASHNNVKFVAIIGNFDKVKGHWILLKAIPRVLKEMEKIKFLFVGEGEEKKCLQRIAKKLKTEDDIIFAGVQQDILSIINLCDLIVLSSLFEGLPLTILEAMALGKPVVATNVGGIPELVENGKTGLLVPARNPEKLAEAILCLLKNKKLAQEMGRKGRIRVQQFFHLRNMIKETENVYLGLVKEKNQFFSS